MRKLLLIAILCLAMFAACSKAEEAQEEPESTSKIDAMTTKVADKAVKRIRTPLDKARATRNLGDERLKAMDEALQGNE